MSVYQDRFQAVVELGNTFQSFITENKANTGFSEAFKPLENLITLAGHKNGWFTRENVLHALEQWVALLRTSTLEQWMSGYSKPSKTPKVFIIMAGNIPLVGFHDYLTAYLAGANIIIKASSNDKILLPWMIDFLNSKTGEPIQNIQIVEQFKGEYDGLIATGSDNTARYFEHYFGSKPHIIRKNRSSIGVLTGHETPEMLRALGEDVFRYYGLGCRSVSKLYVPKGYDFDLFFNAIYDYKDHIHYEKYSNNYDYNKAVYLMSGFKIIDNGFLILKEDLSFSSPIGSLFYETYDNLENLNKLIDINKEFIQCVVGPSEINGAMAFGETQKPSLSDYADGVDTMKFILSL
jgi:hypothetical protein